VHQTAGALAARGGSVADALVEGYQRAFLVGAFVAVAASLSALIIPAVPAMRSESAPEASPEA
jgi:hypothetical protein